MKITKVLMFLIIGILSINLIYAAGIQKSFLIKGDFTIPENSELGAHHPCNTGGSGDCRVTIYGPDSSIDLAPNTNANKKLTASGVKSLLAEGISTNVINITSTTPTVNFTVKIMKGAPNYTEEVLSTSVTVPNPNASGTQISANLFEITDTAPTCSTENAGQIRIINNAFRICKLESSEPGAPYGWHILISGSGGSSGLQSVADFFPFLFSKCPPAGCYVGSVQVGPTANKITLKNNSITNQYIAPGAISVSNLSEDVIELINSKDVINNTYTEVVETYLVDISNDSIDYDHLNIDLKNRLGDIEELDSGAASALTTISNKFYAVHDRNTGDVYYIPVKTSTEFQIDAIRNLVTLSSFDNENFEKKTGNSFSSNYPPAVGLKYSDYLYPRTNRKYASLNKYIPIDVEIRKGATQQFKIEFFECVQLYSDREGLGEKLSATFINSYCTSINSSRIKGTTLNENLTFSGNAVLANVSGTYNKKYHVRLNNNTKKAIVTKITNPNASPPKSVYEVSAGMVDIYDEISDVALTGSPTTCAYVVNTAFPPFTQTRYIMTFPHLQFTATGGSSNSTASGKEHYFTWDIEAYVTGDDISNKVSLASSKVDNKLTGLSNATFSSFVSPANDNPINIIVTIKDNRTGQRFAKTFAITGCTSTPQ